MECDFLTFLQTDKGTRDRPVDRDDVLLFVPEMLAS